MEQPKIHPPASISRLRRPTRRPRNRKLLGIDRLAHQVANQLTVINLTCFKLRTALANIPVSVEADIARLENAVAEMNNLVESLNRLKEQSAAAAPPERTNSSGLAGANNVYPLAEVKKTHP